MKMEPGNWLYVVQSYLFWPAARATGDIRPLATPGWTLNLEMLFYAVFALALFMPRRVGLAFVFVLLGGLVAARVAGIVPGVALNFWGDPIVLGFLLGIVVGLVYLRGWRLPARFALPLMAVGFVLILRPVPAGLAEDDLLARLAVAVPAALILAAFALIAQVDEGRAIWTPLLMIGDASYSLYLIHEFLLRPLQIVWLKAGLGSAPLVMFMIAGAAISLAVALAAYRWFERPVERWLRRMTAPRAIGDPQKAGQAAPAFLAGSR
jgi:peptidoglycan/LPS O-acetylase OafA/YrhL